MNIRELSVLTESSPLVSILIVAYNAEDYIEDAVESCIYQTYENLEIIIVDDGSDDRTVSIAEKYANEDPRIKIYKQDNAGAQVARNYAFAVSNGDYIQYLDSDDRLSLDKIEESINILVNTDKLDICFSKLLYWYPIDNRLIKSGNSIYRDFNSGLEWLIESWSGGGISQTSMWLLSRELHNLAGNWNEELKKNQDGEFFSRVLLNAKKLIFQSKGEVLYRKDSISSISRRKDIDSFDSVLFSISLIRNYIDRRGLMSKKVKQAICRKYWDVLMFYSLSTPSAKDKVLFEINSLNINVMDVIPNKKMKLFSYLLGVRTTLLLRSSLYHLRNRFA